MGRQPRRGRGYYVGDLRARLDRARANCDGYCEGVPVDYARNLFLQELRKKSRAVPLHENIRDPHPGPEAETEKKAAYCAVMARLQQLPELDRAALLMSAFEGMPYGEIARALGISLAAVKMKIHRSRLTLSRLEEPK